MEHREGTFSAKTEAAGERGDVVGVFGGRTILVRGKSLSKTTYRRVTDTWSGATTLSWMAVKGPMINSLLPTLCNAVHSFGKDESLMCNKGLTPPHNPLRDARAQTRHVT